MDLYKNKSNSLVIGKQMESIEKPKSIVESKPIEEDYDFDFSMYEQEDKEDKTLDSVKSLKDNKPRITNLRSKYGSAIQEIEVLINIKYKITEYAIKVASYTDDIKDLWKLYGCLSEYWAKIKDVFGTIIIEDIRLIAKECEQLLIQYTNKNIQNYNVNRALLNYRDTLYMLSQRANLGIEVEKIYGSRDNAKRGIVE